MVRKDSDARDEQARVRSLGISHHGGSKMQEHRNTGRLFTCIERVSPRTNRGPNGKGTRLCLELGRNGLFYAILGERTALAVEGDEAGVHCDFGPSSICSLEVDTKMKVR